jgi:hypothetical protein
MDGDRNTPATKGDLQDLKDELKGEMQSLKDELKGDMQSLKDDLVEAFRDGQTEMLKAFYSFAQSTDAKLKDTEISDIMLRQRLTAVESRLTELEKRLNLPPAA